MNRWTVLSKRGGIIIDWPEYDKRRADEWMARNKKHIDGDTSFMSGAKLVLTDVPTEAETLNAKIDELERELADLRGEPPTPEAERDLEALRELSTREVRQARFEYLAVDLPSGRKSVEKMCKAELLETCYLLDNMLNDERKRHERTLKNFSKMMEK